MLKRMRDLFGRRGKRPSQEAASLPSTGDERTASTAPAAAELPRPEPPPVHRGPSAVHHPIPASDLDPDAVKILRRLTRFDHTAYLVGGCVRDLLLDRRPKDFDIGTSATPRQIKRLFSNCRIIGRRFRLAHIYFQNGKIIEVATFRARDDVEAGDDDEPAEDLIIRDDNVFGTPEEDALRRDFTINALFYDVNTQTVIDHADGLGDLRRKLVRTIGDPGIRFREDPIRILRAIKFAARLGFEIEHETLEALERLRGQIPKAAPARILEEINRYCRGGAARASFDLLQATGVFDVILPEIAEGYRNNKERQDFMRKLFDALDGRLEEGHEVGTGEILAILLLPLLAPAMGWNAEGKVVQSGVVDLRAMADEFFRPLGPRLRVPRRDQEHCRQILLTLQRMLPVRRLRRPQRQSILRRACLREALWILKATADVFRGDFSEALAYWRREGETVPGPRHAAVHPPAETEKEEMAGQEQVAEARSPAEGERKRRRRRQRRSPAAAHGTERPPVTLHATPAPRESGKGAATPAPWDDSYFFAALPTASSLDAADDGDRYGAAALAAEVETPDGVPAEVAGAGAGDGPRPIVAGRRRHRKRR